MTWSHVGRSSLSCWRHDGFVRVSFVITRQNNCHTIAIEIFRVWMRTLFWVLQFLRNPRLGYDLRGNILIIQRYYVCRQKGAAHRYLSASTAVLEGLPPLYANCFPLIMYRRTACTKELVDFVETQMIQEVSFFKICEALAALNFKDYCSRLELSSHCSHSSSYETTQSAMERFYTNELYSFPGNDKLMDIFLSDF